MGASTRRTQFLRGRDADGEESVATRNTTPLVARWGKHVAFVAALSCDTQRSAGPTIRTFWAVREAVGRLVHFRGSHLVRSLSYNFAMIARLGVWTVFAVDISAYNADHTFFFFPEKRRALRAYIFL